VIVLRFMHVFHLMLSPFLEGDTRTIVLESGRLLITNYNAVITIRESSSRLVFAMVMETFPGIIFSCDDLSLKSRVISLRMLCPTSSSPCLSPSESISSPSPQLW
jgi:hypothetical protein